MEKSFWLEKWQKREIGFHQENYNEYLVKYIEQCIPNKGKVLVPLCGKTKDMIYLSQNSHDVLGVELSVDAVKEFFHENNLSYKKEEKGEHCYFISDKITIIAGDIFTLDRSDFEGVEYIYDRASIVALPIDLRERFADLLINKTSIKQGLMVTMSFDDETLGPPFSTPKADVLDLFHGKLKLDELETFIEDKEEVSVHCGVIEKRFEHVFKCEFLRY